MLTTKKGFTRTAREIPVASLADAHERARQHLRVAYTRGIGAVRTWKFVVLDDGRIVAHVSWNGRMWEGDERSWTEQTREIV